MPRPKKRKQQTTIPAIVYQCKDCANSYDWHSKALDGHLSTSRKEDAIASSSKTLSVNTSSSVLLDMRANTHISKTYHRMDTTC